MKEELLFNRKETSSQAWGRAAICGDQVGGLMERKSRKEEHGEIISDKKSYFQLHHIQKWSPWPIALHD